MAGALARVLAPAARLPGVTPPTRADLVRRGTRFTGAIGTLADAPGTLGAVFVAGLAGQLAVATTLWVALAALGTDAPLAVVVILLPVAKLAGAVPTPGGFGSAEAVLTALLMATVGVDAATAASAALLYRATAFWLPSFGGGIATGWYATRPARSSDDDGDGTDVTRPRASPAGVVSWSGLDESRLTVLVVAASATLVVLLAVGVHTRNLLIEPDSLLVHTTRDAALVILSFGITWVALRRVAGTWLE